MTLSRLDLIGKSFGQNALSQAFGRIASIVVHMYVAPSTSNKGLLLIVVFRLPTCLTYKHADFKGFTCMHHYSACLPAGLITRSSFFRSAPGPFIGVFDFITNDLLGVAETVQGGGDCLSFMAVDTSLAGRSGLYYNNMTTGIPGISPGHQFTEKLPSSEAQSKSQAERLWNLSAQLTDL
jgi:hypothetical protein